MAAVLEYICTELLDLSGEICMHNNLKRILPRHLKVTIKNDMELSKLFYNF